ncbi:MAG: hypothetical protein WA890_11670, partial [Micromonospora sp.]
APPELLDFLRPKATGGRLPQWTAWWDESDVAPMFPDPQTRRVVSAEQPRLPLSYYEEKVPVPDGWDNAACGYLLFGPPYEQAAQDARVGTRLGLRPCSRASPASTRGSGHGDRSHHRHGRWMVLASRLTTHAHAAVCALAWNWASARTATARHRFVGSGHKSVTVSQSAERGR